MPDFWEMHSTWSREAFDQAKETGLIPKHITWEQAQEGKPEGDVYEITESGQVFRNGCFIGWYRAVISWEDWAAKRDLPRYW